MAETRNTPTHRQLKRLPAMSMACIALPFTVPLRVTTAYFLIHGLPLPRLEYDSPVDGCFIRRFFAAFRKLHSAALRFNLARRILIVWGITRSRFQYGPQGG